MMNMTTFSADITRADFEQRVLAQSNERLVIADFWAGWCAPCRALKPVLEKLAAEYQGQLFLAKIDTDAEQDLARRYEVRSLPTVKLFRNGAEVDTFMGALPEPQVRAIIDRHLPRASDAAIDAALARAEYGDVADAITRLRETLQSDPASDRARLELAHLLCASGAPSATLSAEVTTLLRELSPEKRMGPEAARIRARLELLALVDATPIADLQRRAAASDSNLETTFQLGVRRILQGDAESGLETLLALVKRSRAFRDDGARKAMLLAFEALGAQHAAVRKFQMQLSRALY